MGRIMKPSKLSRLKHLLQTATDLREPSDYFWEELANEPGFMAAGSLATSSRLQAIAERAATRVLGRAHPIGMTMLLHIAEHAFWHGTCVLGTKMAQVMYFDDIDQGLLTILEDPVTGMTHYVRISTVEAAAGGGPTAGKPREDPSA